MTPPEHLDPRSVSLGLVAGMAFVLVVLVLIKLAIETAK